MSGKETNPTLCVARVLKYSFFIMLVRLVFNCLAFSVSASESLFTIFVDASLDVLLALGSIFVMQLVSKAPSTKYPYGFGKVEYIWTFVQGTLIASTNLFLFLKSLRELSLFTLEKDHSYTSYFFIAVSFVITLIAFILEYRVYRSQKNSVLYSSLMNHLGDLLVYLLGAFGVWSLRQGWPRLDSLFALAIALLVGFEGLRLCATSLFELCDRSLSENLIQKFQNEINYQVCSPLRCLCKDLKSRNAGNFQFLEVKLMISNQRSLQEIWSYLTPLKYKWNQEYPQLRVSFLLVANDL